MVVHHWSDDGMVMYHRRSLRTLVRALQLSLLRAQENPRWRRRARRATSWSPTSPARQLSRHEAQAGVREQQ